MTTQETVAVGSAHEASGHAGGRQKMNIVVIGHVDHGKSTLIGRLLADTGSLPQGKLESVRAQCLRNARPFEYAFLLDALKDEQAQGITIDSARCFFKSASRDYIIIDAPGHVEFLRNMISGAARAEAALLVIDAKEGVQENSRRHGCLLGLLGVRQVAVCVNKMDLVGYDKGVFDTIVAEYSDFLRQVRIEPAGFIPIAAMEGVNIVARGGQVPWYHGPSVLERVDSFQKEPPELGKPLRLPVQDVYKFTEAGDERRIIAGRIETGSVEVGDEVVFLPSLKRSTVASIEEFHGSAPPRAEAGLSTGLTLSTQVYVRPGELLCKVGQEPAKVASKLRASILWLGRAPMIQGKRYKLKLGSARVPVWLTAIHSVLDAGTLNREVGRQQVERHDVADCVLETLKPIACDAAADIPATGRFVIIDNYEIAGGGIILDAMTDENSLIDRHVAQRERAWDRSAITPNLRASRYNQRATLVLITGPTGAGKARLAKALEERLFDRGKAVYYLGLSNALGGEAGLKDSAERDEFLRRIGEVAHLMIDAGLILIAAVSDLDDEELKLIRALNSPGELLIINVGETRLSRTESDLELASALEVEAGLASLEQLLQSRNFLPEYYL
ncbi:MAG: GTP-binding protein [Phycisphaerae bacterium]|jgi:bifunctional enzyme CysN/CysC